MDEFKDIVAEILAANPGLSRMQAQHLAVDRINEEKRKRQEQTEETSNESVQRTRLSLVALDPADDNRNNLMRGLNDRNTDRPEASFIRSLGGGGAFAIANAAAAVNSSMMVSANGATTQNATSCKTSASDNRRCLLKRASCRDPDMLNSISIIQQQLQNGLLDDSESVGGAGSFRSRGSVRSDLSIRSDRSLEAERKKKGKLSKKVDGKANKGKGKGNLITKLFRRKSVDDLEGRTTGSEDEKWIACHGSSRTSVRRRSSHAPSLPDIQEAGVNPNNWEEPIDAAKNNSQRGKMASKNFESSVGSDLSVDVPAGELICNWGNDSSLSIANS